MKRAIDNYLIGRQREVNANEFQGRSISSTQKRFICPECGEYVALVNRYDAEPFFRHTNKTNTSPLCDERVDSTSGLSVYERVGLPLYLRKNSGIQYDLCIGFWALGESELRSAQEIGLSVTVKNESIRKSREMSVKFTIANGSYYADQTTLKLIPFVPTAGGNYKIEYSSAPPKDIKQRWSDHADGFSVFGAVFTCGECGGHKIRRGDSITSDEKYLWAVPHGYIPRFHGLSYEKIGKLVLQNAIYDIYEICFVSKSSTEKDFSNFSNFCRENLKITLLYKQPEVFPIWPPCTLIDKAYSFFPYSNEVICGVSSGNDMPMIYEYFENEVASVQVQKTSSGKKYVCLNSSIIDKPISVDRKFSGNNIVINCRFPSSIGCDYLIKVMDQQGVDFRFGINNNLPSHRQVIIYTNFKAEVLHKKNGQRYIKTKIIDETAITIKDINFNDEIIIYTPSYEVGSIKFIAQHNKELKHFDDHILYSSLLKARTPYVSAPDWLSKVLKQLINYPKTKKLVTQFITSNDIPIGAIQMLKNINLKG